jgi:hypothetical protein
VSVLTTSGRFTVAIRPYGDGVDSELPDWAADWVAGGDPWVAGCTFCEAKWWVDGPGPRERLERWKRDHGCNEEGLLDDQYEAQRHAEFEAHTLEIAMAAPDPADVTPAPIVERIAAAAAEVGALVAAAEEFAQRYGDLYEEMWGAVEAACPKGVPDDYCVPQGEASGWDGLEDSLRAVVVALGSVMPRGLGWS